MQNSNIIIIIIVIINNNNNNSSSVHGENVDALDSCPPCTDHCYLLK